MGLSVALGFTGTQHGMTDAQVAKLEQVIIEYMIFFGVKSFHHGDCIGADERAHKMFYTLRHYYGSHAPIIVHPPANESKRAFLGRWAKNVEVRPAKEYLTRNSDIVRECDVLIAVPRSRDEILRSGTWATVRCARSEGKRIVLIYPDGEVEHEGT